LIVIDSSAVVDFVSRRAPSEWLGAQIASVPTDAAFVALAESLDAVLLTTDARLARAPGIRATVLAP
jgi:predicted nucleic acid-binding protein